ncbi:DUF5685 family protein [Lutispora saccharofermentans]|uniref:DUF5685 family protein n=1 Tax=Lutispora saccharofermentans TaxID=3024236 RepID=A0ABT1NF35_9FIRM|nr:DUF5685 family protein [Lutispora saccharofermentans]MCQ1528451.1 DUF5685 family protein [Lutispora saccharofermentans]
MFGYVTPDKGEMKIKEYELFRAYYCGVCKSMGKSFGPLCRLGLNYDSVFLGLFLSSINKENVGLAYEACAANPLKKKWIVKKSPSVDFSSDINIILTYYKLQDDWEDEKNILAKAAQLLIGSGYRAASSSNKEAEAHIKQSLEKLYALEKQNCSSMDRAADPFGELIKGIVGIGYKGDNEKDKKAVEWLGYNLGRWIYIIDAYDDIEKDVKKNNYNPLLLQYEYKNGDIGAFKDKIKEDIKFNLIHTLTQAASAFELLDMNNRSIIENVIYLGMDKKTKSILEGRSCKKDEKPL